MDERREVLVNRMRHLRQQIAETFAMASRWNATHLDEAPFTLEDVDPGGVMRRCADALDASLAHEARLLAEGKL